MRIGIDLDDTICRTTEIVGDTVEEYAAKKNLDPLDVFNSEKLKYEFFNENLSDIYSNVSVKHDVSSVIKRLKNRGNEIYIITARSDNYVPSIKNVYKITKDWLEKNNIVFDKIIISAYGEFDDREKYDLKEDYVDSWIDIEKYIEKIK